VELKSLQVSSVTPSPPLGEKYESPLPFKLSNTYENNFQFQNKEFIYRGLEWEKIATFTQRLSAEFPNAQVLTSNCQPDEAIKTSEGQFVQVG
jgi:hypothetical protein